RLLGHRLGDLGDAVPDAHDGGGSGGAVDVALAVLVPDVDPLGAVGQPVPAREVPNEDVLAFGALPQHPRFPTTPSAARARRTSRAPRDSRGSRGSRPARAPRP